jgi:uncharacterized membrane protein/protein-disulfide isomerase
MEEDCTLVTIKDRTHILQSWPWWRWILTGLNILALVLCVILSWHYLVGASMIGCNGGSACDDVLNSQWSMIAGVLPVSGLAVGAYLAILVASFFIGPTVEAPIRHLAWSSMLILAGSIAGCAIWFTILQKWVIGKYCLYCMSTHVTGLLLSTMVIWRSIKEIDNNSNQIPQRNLAMITKVSPAAQRSIINFFKVIRKAIIGLVLAGVLAVCQIAFTPSSIYIDGKSQQNISDLDYKSIPMIGSPDAPFVVILLFDYQCPHCQKLHFMLDEAVRRYNGKLSFALCPAPLNTQCNPYITKDVDAFKNSCELAKIGLAVWVAKREAFPAFENWMFSFEQGDLWHPRGLDAARLKAVELVGQTKFNTALTNSWIDKYLQTSIQIYGKSIESGSRGVPKLIFGSHWVNPEPQNVDDLVEILQKSLTLPKP